MENARRQGVADCGNANGEKNRDQIVCWTAALSSDARLVSPSHSRGSLTLRGTMYADDTLRVWEHCTGPEFHIFPKTKVHALAFSPTGRILAAGHGNTVTFHNHSIDSRVTLWDMVTGESIRTFNGHINSVSCVAFSPDGKLLASGSLDHPLVVWNNVQPPAFKSSNSKPAETQVKDWWDELTRANCSSSGIDGLSWSLTPAKLSSVLVAQSEPAAPVDGERIGAC